MTEFQRLVLRALALIIRFQIQRSLSTGYGWKMIEELEAVTKLDNIPRK